MFIKLTMVTLSILLDITVLAVNGPWDSEWRLALFVSPDSPDLTLFSLA